MTLKKLSSSSKNSLYQTQETRIGEYIFTSPFSRAICNNPEIFGVQYTDHLREACTLALLSLREANVIQLQETSTCVLNILRGGLNFGLREALANAYAWNRHSSAFLSAQREQDPKDPDCWYITENTYAKFELDGTVSIILGDVIATGSSLKFGLQKIIKWCQEHRTLVKNIVVFTIGGPRSTEILSQISDECRIHFVGFEKTILVYLEGIFYVPSPQDTYRLALSGTDLMRTNCLMAPEFEESQLESPFYPLERCTIYDAGSRAFHIEEYLNDVRHYWNQVKALAEQGVTYESFTRERCPYVQEKGLLLDKDLFAIAKERLQRLPHPLT
jgi:uracil phosphoribosyltransferase